MNLNDCITIQEDTIDIDGVEALTVFTHYRSFEQKFVDGLVLSEDLNSKSGLTLYTKDTVITPNHVARLIVLQDSQPEMHLIFKIKKNASLIDKFRKEIINAFENIIQKRMKNKIYRRFLNILKDDLQNIIEESLTNTEITLTIYTMKFICESSKIKRSTMFFDHALTIAAFAVALGLSEEYEKIIEKDPETLIDLCKAGVFCTIGAITQIDQILKYEMEKQFEMYLDANQNSDALLSELQLDSEVMDIIHNYSEYFTGRKRFINKDDTTSVMSNILLVAESFLRMESGLFKESVNPRDAVDQINVKMKNNEYNKLAVQVLTLSLNLQDIFDFYEELDILKEQCINKTFAVPFPLVGFMSPTLFVCKHKDSKCEYLEGSLKAVTLVKQQGELKPDRYHRCALLTQKLLDYYTSYYKKIKKDTHTKQK